MIEKGELIVGEINMGWGPINPVPVDVGIAPIPKSHVNTGTVPILESRVNTGTIHIHTSMLTEVQIPQRSDVPTMLLWML